MKKFSTITQKMLNTKGLFKAGRSTNTIFHHCAATPEGVPIPVKSIDSWHRNRGWNEIGYHFYVELDGTIKVGRPIQKIGAHVSGYNRKSIGICYAGGVLKSNPSKAKDTRTPAQKRSLEALQAALIRDNWDIVRIRGHNEVAAKACPSFKVSTDRLGNIHGFSRGYKKG